MILIACPHCKKELGVDNDVAGRVINCPYCSKSLSVPDMALSCQAAQVSQGPQSPRQVRKQKPFWNMARCLGLIALGIGAVIIVAGATSASNSEAFVWGAGFGVVGLIVVIVG
jgi:hypothetical protein